MYKIKLPIIAVLFFTATACDVGSITDRGPGGDGNQEIQVNLSFIRGNDQTGVTGETLEDDVIMQVMANGQYITNLAVTWQTSSGSVSPQTTVTDGHGMASTKWTLGSSPGEQTLIGTVDADEDLHLTFKATAVSAEE